MTLISVFRFKLNVRLAHPMSLRSCSLEVPRLDWFNLIFSILSVDIMLEKSMSDQPLPAMTVREVARFLAVDEKTIYRLAQQGRLPGFKVAGAWRFQMHDNDIQSWIDLQKAAPTQKVEKATGLVSLLLSRRSPTTSRSPSKLSTDLRVPKRVRLLRLVRTSAFRENRSTFGFDSNHSIGIDQAQGGNRF
jgi:excisionase family DNA binding protein